MMTNLPSIIPRPRPAFHQRLQYIKGMESWAGPGNEAQSANTVDKIAKLYSFKILEHSP